MSNASYEDYRIKGIDYLNTVFGGDAVERAVENTMRFMVEVPAWQLWSGFGGGGRFEGAGMSGAARTTGEIAQDAGLIHRLTGSTPCIGQHMLWFFSGDRMYADYDRAVRVRDELETEGVRMGSVNPTYFLAGSEDGSFSAMDRGTRERYIEQTVLGARIAAELGNGILSLWFPDGTNYPGQRELQDKIGLLKENVSLFWDRTPREVKSRLDRVLFEYKVFEPGTYSTTVPDWGTARELSRLVGDWGAVLVDLGHHHHGTNIEQIVAHMIAFGIRGGFHFNTRYAADDDHSVQADYGLARLFHELLRGNAIFNDDTAENWSFGLDQMPRAEELIPAVLKSVDALKRSVAKASLLDVAEQRICQEAFDVIGSNVECERALLHADTGPVVMESYVRLGLHPVPLEAFHESGYQKRIVGERSQPLKNL